MNKIRFSYIVFILLLCVVLFGEMYNEYMGKKIKYRNCPKEEVDEEIKNIIIDKKKKLSDKMIESCKDGLLKGCVTGCMTGGIHGAISGGILFGMANPVVTYINHKK